MKKILKLVFWTWAAATLAAWPAICLAAIIYDYTHPEVTQTCACQCRIDSTTLPVAGSAFRGR